VSNFDSAACAALLEEMTAISIAAAEAIRGALVDRGVRLKHRLVRAGCPSRNYGNDCQTRGLHGPQGEHGNLACRLVR
jgi:hypothetical protein